MPVNYGSRSDRIYAALNPKSGIRDEQKRAGVTPHDHSKDNRLRIKALQTLNKERAAAKAAAAEAAAVKKPSKYPGIGSIIAADLSKPTTPSSTPRATVVTAPANFACPKPSGPPGRIFTAWAPPPLLSERSDAELKALAKKKNPPVPPRPTSTVSSASAVDFVKRNAELSSLTPQKAKTVAAGVPKGAAVLGSPRTAEKKSKFHGRVPPYLLDRKLELAEKAAAEAKAKAPRECPEGTHFLPEEERLQVLEMIAKGQAKVHADLDKMPFVCDTYGLRTRHETLTQQLQQLEHAEKAFGHPKVIVTDAKPEEEPLPPPEEEPAPVVEEPVDVTDFGASSLVAPYGTKEDLGAAEVVAALPELVAPYATTEAVEVSEE